MYYVHLDLDEGLMAVSHLSKLKPYTEISVVYSRKKEK